MVNFKEDIINVIKAMGLVFGDIGTSPIYTFTVIFLTLSVNFENIVGILSLIIWTLLLVVTLQYAFLAMSLSKKGEGGAIVLNEIFKKLVKSSRSVVFTSFLTYIGISLLIGDSVITPAISILSAVEGLKVIPSLHNLPQCWVLIITLVITGIIFFVQKNGTEKIAKIFGPIMLLWFLVLGVFGFSYIINCPQILIAINPLTGIKFMLHHGLAGFFVLSEVILCATGAEALYADMGHLGRKPIVRAWVFVCIMLLINYLGQGAFLYLHPDAGNILFSMIMTQCHYLFIPFLLLSIMATVIASQAMISGLFSIVYQGINTRIFPLFKIDYTSYSINSQIYIGAANWFLLFFVVVVILFFQKSENLAAAYGLAVTGTITITATMISLIFYLKKRYFQMVLSMFLWCIDFCFLAATSMKIPHGAYWSLIIAVIPFLIILIYTNGNKMLYKSMHLMEIDTFLEKFNKIYSMVPRIKGTAIFFTRGIQKIPPYIVQTLFANNIVYTDNVLVQITKSQEAFCVNYSIEKITDGLQFLNISVGYMEVINLEKILKNLNIKEKVMFYGVEDIETKNPIWKIFAFIKKITPTFVSFYKLPSHKIHGVITQIKTKPLGKFL